LYTVACRAVNQAKTIILEAMERPRQVNYKGLTDLVTETDRQSEKVIMTTIQDAFPDHAILAEETGGVGSTSEFLWVVDPLDGTTNFVHGYPSFAVSVGVLHHGQPVVGVVAELPADHLYTAVRGQGAYRDGRRLHVSPIDRLDRALLVTGFGYQHAESWQANMELFKHFTDVTQGVRRLGAAAVDLCHVALGCVDGFWEFDLHPWDTAAGMLIVQEAGGKITRLDGEPYSIYDRQLLATNGKIHAPILAKTEPVVKSLLAKGVTLKVNL
jgi:myo-inositol-1(or 4)-monophosphatase